MSEVTPSSGVAETPAPPPISADTIGAAVYIREHRNADTLGARFRAQYNLGTFALGLGTSVAAGYTMLVDGGLALTDIPTGLAYGVSGNILIGSAAYTIGRVWEARRVQRAADRQAAVREGIGEPIDILPGGLRSNKKAAVLRWYGCDKAFTQPPTADETAQADTPPVQSLDPIATLTGLERVVALAKEAKLTHITMSARILELLPQEKKKAFGQRQILTPMATRRIEASDLLADKTALLCTTSEAEALLRELEKKAGAVTFARVAQLLQSNHPFQAYAERLIKDPQDTVARSGAGHLLRERIERATTGDDTMKARIRDEHNHTIGFTHVGTVNQVVGTTLRHQVTLPSIQGASLRFASGLQHTDLLEMTGFATVDKLLAELEKPRTTLSKPTIEHLAEVAAYLLLQNAKASGTARRGTGTQATERTFQERVADENQRTWLGYLRKHGRHNGHEPTIEYGKKGIPRLRRALGTLTLFATMVGAGGTIGYVLHSKILASDRALMQSYAVDNGYKNGELPVDQYAAFSNYVRHAGGIRAFADRTYGAIRNFDTTLVGASAPLIPQSLLMDLAPLASTDWIYEKESALRSYDNAYSDGANSAGIGDVYTNPNGIAWSLKPSPGADTTGYWVQSMQDFVNTDTGLIGLPSLTPPYQNFGVNFLESDPNKGYTDTARFLDLPSPEQLPTHAQYIEVTGTKLFDSQSESQLFIYEESTQQTVGHVGFALPVLDGDRVAAASAKLYALDGNKYIGAAQFQIAQLPNGTFYLLMDSSMLPYSGKAYVDISYWITPNSTKERAHATTPLAMDDGQGDHTSIPFAQGYSTADALQVWRQLTGNPHATKLPTAEEAASYIEWHRKYSFTPYADNHVPLSLDHPANANQGLAVIGTTATSMTSADCNIAMLMDVLSSQGRTADGGYVNSTTGYHNQSGDTVLRTGDAHAWLTSNTDKIIDATPIGSSPPATAGGEAFNPDANPGDVLVHDLKLALRALLASGLFAVAGYVAKRQAPHAKAEIAEIRASRAAAAAKKLLPIPDPESEGADDAAQEEQQNDKLNPLRRVHRAISILEWMGYGAEGGGKLVESQLPAHFQTAESRSLVDRYHGLPPTSKRKTRQRIAGLEGNGSLQLSRSTRKHVIALAGRHKRAQLMLKALFADAYAPESSSGSEQPARAALETAIASRLDELKTRTSI